MSVLQAQQLLFQQIKAALAPNISLVDEIAQRLNISNDSAYRRIRGEKPISFDELQTLATHYRFSVDKLIQLGSDTGTFTGKYIKEDGFNFREYLERMVIDLQYINSFGKKEITFLSKDIPVFHYFSYPELAAFKYFFWMKTILQFNSFANTQFSIGHLMEDVMQSGVKVINTYNKVPSTEIMSIENINTTLRQIEFYKETYQFKYPEEIDVIYNRLHEMADHIGQQAERGRKFMPGQPSDLGTGTYKLYVNDFIIGDNSNIVLVDDNKLSFIIHAHVNYLLINDPVFTAYHYSFVQNIVKKSILISEVGEKYRSRFFYLIHDKIDQCRNNQLQMIGKL